MAFIYRLIDPRTNETRYVGKTNNIERRYKEHCKNSDKYPIHNWINKLKSLDLLPLIEIIEECDDSIWNEREIFWVSYYRRVSGRLLLNCNDGGRGGHNPSETTRLKMSIMQQNRPPASEETRRKIADSKRGKPRSPELRKQMSESRKGKKHSDEARRKMSMAGKGRKQSDEHKRKRAESRKGKKHSDETRQKMSRLAKNRTESEKARFAEIGRNASESNKKAILQYDKFGNFIRQWDSIIEAGETLNIGRPDITNCCKRKYKSAGGYIWRYADDPILGIPPTQLKLDFE